MAENIPLQFMSFIGGKEKALHIGDINLMLFNFLANTAKRCNSDIQAIVQKRDSIA